MSTQNAQNLSTHNMDLSKIKEQGYTLREIGEALGVSRTTFYNYRTGRRSMPKALREKMRKLLS